MLGVPCPRQVRSALAAWGPRLHAEWQAAAREIGVDLTVMRACPRVGTDCSGLEAPVLALVAMGIRHRHVSSCDCAPSAQSFLKANTAKPGGPLRPAGSVVPAHYPDMLRRDHNAMPDLDVYVCGFPCQPFSTLHHGSRVFRDPKARPFYAMLATIRARLPALAVLENVVGIHRVLGRVWRHLLALRWCTRSQLIRRTWASPYAARGPIFFWFARTWRTLSRTASSLAWPALA